VIRRLLAKRWDTEDVAKLKELVDSGASALRAAAALGRPITSVKRKAYDLGISLPSVRKVRADLRAKGAIEGLRHRYSAEKPRR
jgi:GcrA cell cycle regulator